MRLLIEMTETALHGYNTGVQRVVRHVVRRAARLGHELGVEMVPVVSIGRRVHRLRDLDAATAVQPMTAPLPAVAGGRPESAPRRFVRWAAKQVPGLRPAILRQREARRRQRLLRLAPEALDWVVGDVLLLLDAFWGSTDLGATVEAAGAAGVRLVPVIYDLIPMTHREYFPATATAEFQARCAHLLGRAEAVLAISATVAEQVRAFQQQPDARQARALPPCPVGFFHLGSDFGSAPSVDGPEPTWGGWPPGLWDHQAVFLMVGTIEPRKQHALVLEAFESRWQAGADEALLVLGRLQCIRPDLRAALDRAAAERRPFFQLSNVPDGALREAIGRSRAGIVASRAEGFGLPLIEFMQLGLPVLASDIPVFREVGGDAPLYFPPGRATDLSQAVDRFYRDEVELRRRVRDFRWLSWDEAVAGLFRQVLAHLGAAAPGSR